MKHKRKYKTIDIEKLGENIKYRGNTKTIKRRYPFMYKVIYV